MALQPSSLLSYYGPCILVINDSDIVIYKKSMSDDHVIVTWKLHHLRSFRAKKDCFIVKTGRYVQLLVQPGLGVSKERDWDGDQRLHLHFTGMGTRGLHLYFPEMGTRASPSLHRDGDQRLHLVIIHTSQDGDQRLHLVTVHTSQGWGPEASPSHRSYFTGTGTRGFT